MPDMVKSESLENLKRARDRRLKSISPAATPRPISPERLAEIYAAIPKGAQETVERMNQRFRDNPNLQVSH